MTTNIWGSDAQAPLVFATGLPAAGQALFDVADSGGVQVGLIAYKNSQATVSFFDEMGVLSAARPTTVLATGTAPISEVAITASGVLGYGAGWIEADTHVIKAQYFGAIGAYGAPITLGTGHGLEMAGYFLNDAQGKKPAVDGFAATWIGDDGNVYFQRTAVNLDAKKFAIGDVGPAGLDGIPGNPPVGATAPGNTDLDAAVKFDVGGKASETTISITDAGEIMLAWTVHGTIGDTVQMTVLNKDGTTNFSAALPNIIPAGAHIDSEWLALGGFVVAWNTANSIQAITFTTPGARTPGIGAVFTSSGVVTLQDFGANGFTGHFTLGNMLPSVGGFTLGFTEGGQVKEQSYNFVGAVLDQNQPQAIVVGTADPNSQIASTSLIGDRVLIVSEQTDGTLGASIVDPRSQTLGLGIVLNGPGITLAGLDRPTKAVNDVVVGTIGNDTINGGAGADTMDGALGNDRIIAGFGNDVINGGGGMDTLVLSGQQSDYIIVNVSGNLFQITDKRSGLTFDGVDLVRSIELFEFAGATALDPRVVVPVQVFSGAKVNITPSAWGLTNADADALPSVTRTPDVDGFIANNGVNQAGIQSAPVVSDSIGQFVSVVWEDHAGGGSHIKGNFYDVEGKPDTFNARPNTVALSDGVGVEFGAQVASGGFNSGWGVVFSELRADGTAELKTNFYSVNLLGAEQAVDASGVNQHDASVFGSYLDHKLNPITGLVDGPALVLFNKMNDGYNVIYVEGPQSDPYGAIRLQRFEVAVDSVGTAVGPARAAGIDGLAGVGSDAAVTLATSGRDPSITAFNSRETVAVWIQKDANGAEHVVGTALDDLGQTFGVDLSNISGTDVIATGSKAVIAQAQGVNGAIVWVADVGTAGNHTYELRATMLSSPGKGLDGHGFSLVAPAAPFTLMTLPTGVNLSSIRVTGIGGEDSPDLVVQWDGVTAGDSNVYARHIGVVLDPTTGAALAMWPVGNTVQINANAQGDQSHSDLTGLLSDRFFSVCQDNNTAITGGNGSDIVAQIYDLRDPNHDPNLDMLGDFVSPIGKIVARPDIIVGTNGNDFIRGDISDSIGLSDWLFGGMGDDTLQGGPGNIVAAPRSEILDGGAGTDTAIYTGYFANYTMTAIVDAVHGAGFQITDLRAARIGNVAAQNDGFDFVFNVENFVFADQVINVQSSVPANNPPTLIGDLNATVSKGASVVLTVADIGYTDLDVADVLTFSASGAVNGAVQLNGVNATSFTMADVSAGRITFLQNGANVTSASFALTVTDGKVVTAPVTVQVAVTLTNVAPILTGTVANATYVENAPALSIAPALVLTDMDNATLAGATVSVSGGLAEDRLTFTTRPGITGTFAAGTLTLSGTASLADYQAVLRSVAYPNSSDRPDTTPRTITFTVNDGGAVNATGTASTIVAVQSVNDLATGAVSIVSAATVATAVTLTATSNLQDADLVNPVVVPTYSWQSSTTLAGVYANLTASAAAVLTATTATVKPAAVAYYQVLGTYTDPFGLNAVTSVDRAVVGTAAANTILTDGVDFLSALAGNDIISYATTSKVGLVLDGGAGTDTVNIAAGVTSFAPASDAKLVGIEAVSASALLTAITLNLSSQTEALTITGGAGNDTILGGTGADKISGGNGNDLILSGLSDGNDTVNGGAGVDTFDFSASTGTLTVNLGLATGQITGSLTGIDTVTLVENIIATAAANSMIGNTAANQLEGIAGNDTIRGGAGNDTLLGGADNDSLFGDVGVDTLTGGTGADRFVFNTAVSGSVDTITDFEVGAVGSRIDRIEFSQAAFLIGAGTVATGTWLSLTGAFTTTTQRIAYTAATGSLDYDSNGSAGGGTRFQIGIVDINNNLAQHPLLDLDHFALI